MTESGKRPPRMLKYFEAINEALGQLLEADGDVYVQGLGADAPLGIFGTTRGLAERFPDRVLDMPSSEAGMAGIALGSTILGYRPILVHMRVDFSILAMDQMVNQIAKWHFMYGGKMRAPMVFRMIVGRGWGQGPQHSQSLQAWFAHVPGFRVVMPTTARDVKGMLIAATASDAPVAIFEHRWLYDIRDDVPEGMYETSLDTAKILRPGKHVTIAATSYMALESMRAAETLATIGIDAEVIDIRSLVPLDIDTIAGSARKTGHLLVADTGTLDFGITGEIVSRVTEREFASLKQAPRRIGLPFAPSPTAPELAEKFFPRAPDIARAAAELVGADANALPVEPPLADRWHDRPDLTFTGPY
ncbi:MAG: transketolase C-terminal domain-containing protein [Rhodospirillales bacterium]